MSNPTGKNTNGCSNSPTYVSWNCMRKRVHNKKQFPSYQHVKIDPRWENSYQNFLDDMGERPEGTTLDRIDPYGDYCKENCRWADQKTQQRNRTNNKIYIINGRPMIQREIAEMIGIHDRNLWKQIHYQHRTIQEILDRYGVKAVVG